MGVVYVPFAVLLLWGLVGFLLPAIPLLYLAGRLVSKSDARVMAHTSDEVVVAYHSDMGWLHRVWLSEGRPVTSHWRAWREGKLVWMPFARPEDAEALFGDRLVFVGAGHRWDDVGADGRTLFDKYWESLSQRKQSSSRERRTQ